ncbi:nucleotidyltransferase [Microbulbifer sp. SSSA002]|uniref:nucleotidyltransferase domain-containing protein n=1 Tax=Microbulbifer sp. SSSA002 TaxID=3243376 RepID=UPI004039B7EE
MADLQKQFDTFHDDIKLSNEKELLREKREILKQNLEAALKNNDDAPSVDKYLLQGSYATYTGINPANGDYDIDVGVLFDCTKDDIGAMKLKKLVKEALEHTSRSPVIKNPCITTQYMKNGTPDYHVDMPVYVKRDDSNGYDLAWGKSASSEVWVQSDPEGLNEEINGKYSNDSERYQFRRIVKYLKAWKSKKFSSYTVPSIGLCLAAMDHFSPEIDTYEDTPNDLIALRKTISNIIGSFNWVSIDDNGKSQYRLKVLLPVTPGNDVFEKLTDRQMTELKEKLEALKEALVFAEKEERIDKGCKEIKKHLPNFPVPPVSETAKAATISINNTGSSS